VALSLTTRQAGDVTILACRGRLVEGVESAALQKHLEEALPFQSMFVLDLCDIDFIDSSGLGLLVRFASRLRNDGGDLKLCTVSSRVAAALQITRVNTVLESYESEAAAIAAFSHSPRQQESTERQADVVCIAPSADLLAYLREVLQHAGYSTLTTTNLSDAQTLLATTSPQLLIIDSQLRPAIVETGFGARFNALPIIELPADFSTSDAGDASRQLIERVRAAIG